MRFSLRRWLAAVTLSSVLFLVSSGPSWSAKTIDSEKAMTAFLDSLGPDLLAELLQKLPEANTQASHELLKILQQEMGQSLFVHTVLILCEHQKILKDFLDASAKETPLPVFIKIMEEIEKNPEVIRAITLSSITNQSDEDILKVTKRATMHAESLKLFAAIMDERILAEFSKKTFEDRKAMSMVIQGLKDHLDQVEDFTHGVDLKGISRKIVEQLDKSYFKNLLAPDHADRELLIHSLSLIDGVIDVQGQEKIDLKSLNRQTLKILDPAFVITFLWNIYFGDKTSQIALHFRKSLAKSDESDGAEDGVVNLRLLAISNANVFDELHKGFSELLEVSRFQKKFTDPDLILEPTLQFVKANEAEVVADTLSPLFIRSLDIQPRLAKIVVLELPPHVIGALLTHLVDFMASTPEGKKILREMTVNLWQSMDAQALQTFVRQVLEKSPQALHNMVVPVMLDLSPAAVTSITLAFTKYPEVFYRFNLVALENLPPASLSPIVRASTSDRREFYKLAKSVVHRNPIDQQNAYFERLQQNEAYFTNVDLVINSLDEQVLKSVAQSILTNPNRLEQMQKYFPKRFALEINKSYQKRNLN